MGLLDDNLIDVSDDKVNYMMSLGRLCHIYINIGDIQRATNHISIDKLMHIYNKPGGDEYRGCPVYINGALMRNNIPNAIKYILNIVSNWNVIDLTNIANDVQYAYKLILPWYKKSFNTNKILIEIHKHTGMNKLLIVVYVEEKYSFGITFQRKYHYEHIR